MIVLDRPAMATASTPSDDLLWLRSYGAAPPALRNPIYEAAATRLPHQPPCLDVSLTNVASGVGKDLTSRQGWTECEHWTPGP